MAYLDSQNVFIYGGGYGDDPDPSVPLSQRLTLIHLIPSGTIN